MKRYLRIPDEDDFILHLVGPGEYRLSAPAARGPRFGHYPAHSDFFRTSHAKICSIGLRPPAQISVALRAHLRVDFVHLSHFWLLNSAELGLPCSALLCSGLIWLALIWLAETVPSLL